MINKYKHIDVRFWWNKKVEEIFLRLFYSIISSN